MPIPFTKYAQIKDKYCCSYLGNSPEYIIALKLLKPQIEQQLPGLKLWINCRDEFSYLIEENMTTKLQKEEFAYVREIKSQNKHGILNLMEESSLNISPIVSESTRKPGICLICPEGIFPTNSLDQHEVNKWFNYALKQGYKPIILGSDIHYSLEIGLRPNKTEKFQYIEQATWIIGVENEYLVLGAAKGLRTTLIDTGIGAKLYKKMFPMMEISTK